MPLAAAAAVGAACAAQTEYPVRPIRVLVPQSPGASNDTITRIVAGMVVIWAIDALEYLRIDDPIGAVPVHMVAGIWGTLSLGLFATGQYGVPTPMGVDTSTVVKGLFYGGGMTLLFAQLQGIAAVGVYTLAVSLAFW